MENKLYQNVLHIYALMNIPFNPTNINHSELLLSLCVLYFSNYKFRLNSVSNQSNMISYVNKILQMTNSKFIIPGNSEVSIEDFITLTLYLIYEYDMVTSLIDEMKNIENSTMKISFSNIIASLNPSSQSDNLYLSIQNKSKSTLEANNKLNFVIKNIKKQIDLLINLAYKLSLLNSSSHNSIEDIILLSSSQISTNLFNSFFYDMFSISNEVLNSYLQNIPNIIDILDMCYEIYPKLGGVCSSAIINDQYNQQNTNKKVKTAKNIFLIKIFCESGDMLGKMKSFINILEDKLNVNFALIKEKNIDLLNDKKVTDMIDKLSVELEKFIAANEKSTHSLFSSFDEGVNNCENEIDMINNIKKSKNENLDDIYQNYIFVNNGIESIFTQEKKNIINFLNINSNLIGNKYVLYNISN